MTKDFKPDWDEKTVLVAEMQRMAKRIEELEQKVAARSAEHLAAHITHDKGYQEGRQDAEKTTALERNFCHRCGKRLMSALGPVSLHTCCPPQGRTFDDYGNKLP
jgi:septal ring factor EnvC (AmiA/AmiB activator)